NFPGWLRVNVELCPTAAGSNRYAKHADVLTDASTSKAGERSTSESFSANFDVSGSGELAGAREAFRDEVNPGRRVHPPPEMPADAHPSLGFGPIPMREDASLQIRAPALLGAIGLGSEHIGCRVE